MHIARDRGTEPLQWSVCDDQHQDEEDIPLGVPVRGRVIDVAVCRVLNWHDLYVD